MEEIWKPIPDYEGYYEISNTGKIRSITRTTTSKDGKTRTYIGKEKSLGVMNGYLITVLSKKGINKTYMVHRLVAEVFLPNPNNLPCVNHKDEDRLNNNVNNLEWCTYKYNNNYGNHNEKVSQALKQSKQHPILMCDKNTHEPIKEFSDARTAAKELNSPNSYSNIYQVLKGNRQTALNYWWKYKDNT